MTARPRLLIGLGCLLLVWCWLPWWWPWLLNVNGSQGRTIEVIAVAAGDFRRAVSAVALWRRRPWALLALPLPEGKPEPMTLQVLRDAGLNPAQKARLRWIPTCGDSVTEMADLTRWLDGLPGSGSLTVVTSPEHLPRLERIARVMAGSRGWRVDGLASLTSEHKPETVWRLVRDELRAQLWRVTGWTGRDSLVCPARARGLL